jgi:hypothetical protein
MNINDFNGTIPDGRLNPPNEMNWGKDMEQEKSCKTCRFWEKKWADDPCYYCELYNHYEPIPSPEGEPDGEEKA